MNPENKNLHLYEEVMLLALRDKEGTLMLEGRIYIETDRERKFVILRNASPTGDEILDESLHKLSGSKRRQQVRFWIRNLSGMKRLKQRVVQSLVKKRILKVEEESILLLFKRKIYPEIDPRPEKRILDRIYRAIFTNTQDIEPATLVLIAICDSTGLLRPNFDRKKLREKKSRIRNIVQGNVVGKATREAVEAMQAAVVVATIIPSVTVAATAGAG